MDMVNVYRMLATRVDKLVGSKSINWGMNIVKYHKFLKRVYYELRYAIDRI